MTKTSYFLEKRYKIAEVSAPGFAPEPPFASGGWRIRHQTLALLLLHVDISFIPFPYVPFLSYSFVYNLLYFCRSWDRS